MTAVEEYAKDLMRCRPYIEAALEYADGVMDWWDLVTKIERGEAQFWPGPASAVITEIIVWPSTEKSLHIMLAGGKMGEISAMQNAILKWGTTMGCRRAHLTGRKGWARSFLTKTGWKIEPKVILSKDLTE